MSSLPDRRPNILLIVMDDLAWGDLACHGNTHTRTPHLDRLHDASARLTRYCSGPLCTPARASLMTGRYPYRTRAIDTYIGRSMMDPGETTIAELLRRGGYRTGLFGKWHLGDCYPMRAMDQGFQETLVHNGGGIGQYGDIHGQSYFDPILHHNGVPRQQLGYCTDVFTEAACAFIEAHRRQPFFACLATNAPHSPLEIGDAWTQTYRDQGLPDATARLYGMVENIDWNVGRVLDHLQRLGLSDDTIVIYTSDHGPCGSSRNADGSHRWNAGLRGLKGTMYEGGIKVPCFIRWPRRLRGGDYGLITNPIDLLPTLAAATHTDLPAGVRIDGLNLLPFLDQPPDDGAWPDRPLFMQWHRGDAPDRYRNYAVITQRYKLYHPEDAPHEELYDIHTDPSETRDLAPAHDELVRRLRRQYEEWFDDVSTTRGKDNYAPPRIHIGTLHENPTVLTRQDWRWIPTPGGGLTGWRPDDEGFWELYVARVASFRIRLRVRPRPSPGDVTLRIGGQTLRAPLPVGASHVTFEHIVLPIGDARLEAWVESDNLRGGVIYVDIFRPLSDLPAETMG